LSDRLALANAIEDAGIERSKAERVASVIFDAIHDNVATKADVQASEASIRSLLAAETARLDTRIERLDGKLKPLADQIMLRLGALMVVLTGVILAALRYLPPGHSG
jgi:hypothetical protein